MKTKKTISKRQLQKYLNELVAIARNLTPDVETSIQIPGVEGRHAWLGIYVPDELEEKISDLVNARANEIFIETGYDIGAIVHERPMHKKSKISQRQLQKYLDEIVAIAKNITPDIETLVQIPGVEGQHAWLEIYVPNELEEQISDAVSERVLDIFSETGYDIGAIVHEKSDLRSTAGEPKELVS